MGIEHAGVLAANGLGNLVVQLLDLVPRLKKRRFQPADLRLHPLLTHLDPGRHFVLRTMQPHDAPGDSGRDRHTLKTAFKGGAGIAHGRRGWAAFQSS